MRSKYRMKVYKSARFVVLVSLLAFVTSAPLQPSVDVNPSPNFTVEQGMRPKTTKDGPGNFAEFSVSGNNDGARPLQRSEAFVNPRDGLAFGGGGPGLETPAVSESSHVGGRGFESAPFVSATNNGRAPRDSYGSGGGKFERQLDGQVGSPIVDTGANDVTKAMEPYSPPDSNGPQQGNEGLLEYPGNGAQRGHRLYVSEDERHVDNLDTSWTTTMTPDLCDPTLDCQECTEIPGCVFLIGLPMSTLNRLCIHETVDRPPGFLTGLKFPPLNCETGEVEKSVFTHIFNWTYSDKVTGDSAEDPTNQAGATESDASQPENSKVNTGSTQDHTTSTPTNTPDVDTPKVDTTEVEVIDMIPFIAMLALVAYLSGSVYNEMCFHPGPKYQDFSEQPMELQPMVGDNGRDQLEKLI